jgi:hypothetical protein
MFGNVKKDVTVTITIRNNKWNYDMEPADLNFAEFSRVLLETLKAAAISAGMPRETFVKGMRLLTDNYFDQEELWTLSPSVWSGWKALGDRIAAKK